MVDVARHVPALGAVDGPARIDLKHIARAARLEPVGLRIAHQAAAVRHDVLALLEGFGGEQTESRARSADAIFTIWHGVDLGCDSPDGQQICTAPWTTFRVSSRLKKTEP